MRIIGVDFGEVRMGLSVSDPTGFLAGGIGTFKVTGIKSAVDTVCEKVAEYSAELVVVGLPRNMDGTEGDRAARSRKLAAMINEKCGVAVDFCDERRTTILAAGYMSETGTFGKKRKQAIDTLSAQIILQDYLDRQKNAANK
ncbi:MAG: Holliday junction resolvase RuvX [Clostridia bacterium]|nr:Holliday junction resolvase RuvX [Clostridia bacterium]